MILIMSRDEVFMGRERGKPSWCRILTFQDEDSSATMLKLPAADGRGLIRMEALEKIMGSEFIYLDIWYLVFINI